MELDHEVDVFHAVKLIRINRPQMICRGIFISSAESVVIIKDYFIFCSDEYKYLYDLLLHWFVFIICPIILTLFDISRYMTNPELRSYELPDEPDHTDHSDDNLSHEGEGGGGFRRSRSGSRRRSSRRSRRFRNSQSAAPIGGHQQQPNY
jgi:hypothetical protein